ANSLTSQSATAGTAVSTPPSVILKDANGNPVTGVAVTFAVAPGNGTITGGRQTTNGSGIATVGSWTLRATAGDNTLTATSGSLSGSPVTFAETGTAGAAATIARNAGGTSATAWTAVSPPPSVIVKDANGNPVANVAVTFTPAAGSGTVTPTTPVNTGADGIAALTSWTLSPTAGTNILTATASGLTGSPVTFTATGTAGPAATIAANGGGTSAPAGTAVSHPPSVIVKEASGNAVASVEVTFATAEGSGTVTRTTRVNTGAGGIAALTSWTPGR